MVKSQDQINKEWRAQSDADTLAEAEEIKKSKSRTKAAIRSAEKTLKDAKKAVGNVKKQVKGKK